MAPIIVILCLAALIVLISYFKIDVFLSFLAVSIVAGLVLGLPPEKIPSVVGRGISNIMGSLTLIIVIGAMLGKLVAESGAAERIATLTVTLFGIKGIQWGMIITGLVVGIPLFYGVGFILLAPLIFSIAYRYKLSSVYVGLPMLAALSATHALLPPHPSPTALSSMLHADMGRILLYGLVIAVPAISLAGYVFSKTLKNIKPGRALLFEQKTVTENSNAPGKFNSIFSATLPVLLIAIFTTVSICFKNLDTQTAQWLSFIGNPAIVMLIAIGIATYTLGLRQKKSITAIMSVYVGAVKDVSGILLIIAGSGVFKEVMEESHVSSEIAAALQQLAIPPLVLGWLIAAIIRGCVGSATVAALTAAGVVAPLAIQSQANPNLMVLAIGSGSLMFSHVNDAGFWMFKEYFNISLRETFRSWSIMEVILSITGLIGVLAFDVFV